MLLPADTEQFADEDRANFGKLLGLLAVFLVGCGCWLFVWQRELARFRSAASHNVQVESVKTPSVELIQQAQEAMVGSRLR